ncbi:MAG: hypothetical protein AAFV37_14325, partial [Pseudomonadota bacterium]
NRFEGAQPMTTPNQTTRLRDAIAEIDRHYKLAHFSTRLIAEQDSSDYPERFFLSDKLTSCDLTAFAELNVRDRPDAPDPRQASLAIATLVNAWPTIRSALLDVREWRDIEELPEDGSMTRAIGYWSYTYPHDKTLTEGVCELEWIGDCWTDDEGPIGPAYRLFCEFPQPPAQDGE